MSHLTSFVHLTSLMVGFSAGLFGFIYYLKDRKRLYLLISLFALSMFSMVLGLSLMHYGDIAGINTGELSLFLNGLGSMGFILVVPPLLYRLFSVDASRAVNIGYLVFSLCVVAASLTYLLFYRAEWLLISLQTALFALLAYGLIFAIINLKNIGSRPIRTFLRNLFITTIIFSPLLIIDSLMSGINWLPNNICLPLLNLTICVEIIYFGFTYFNQPPFFSNNSLTEQFVGMFGLTPREKEITEFLLIGKSNKEIGEKLFISAKTVENHFSHIYQKSGVKNRTQLVNLIFSNSAD